MVLIARRGTALLLAGVAMLVAGCQSSGHRAPAEPPDPWPLNGVVHFTAAEESALWQAEEDAVRACMSERGHAYVPVETQDPRRTAAASPYGLLRPGWSESDGYGMTAALLDGPAPDPNEDHLSGLGGEEAAAWRRALLGDEQHARVTVTREGPALGADPGSCVGVARTEVYGVDWPDLYHPMAQLSNEVVALTRESGGFRGAEALWAGCMAERGLAYESLEDPRREIEEMLTEGVAPRAAGERERELARTDLECQLETELHEEVERAQQEVEQSVGAQARLELERYEQAKLSALERSKVGRE